MFKKLLVLSLTALTLALIAACGAAQPETVTVVETVVVEKEVEVEKIVTVEVEAVMEEKGPLKVFGAYATAIEEPWDGVIHSALNKAQGEGLVEYTFTDDIGYAGDMERILREVAENECPFQSVLSASWWGSKLVGERDNTLAFSRCPHRRRVGGGLSGA